ncbi:hypothetical protein RhiLY_04591 [Ceratobasidium sp. AG-Ba]|nr:hypothetical protein RhiLY_04591 [Ceratobasidium sp. AG-Ba]
MASSPLPQFFFTCWVTEKARPRLRHPSRLRSKDLNENRHQVVISIRRPHIQQPYYSTVRRRSNPNQSDATPKRPSRPISWELGSPTPKKPTSRRQLSPVPPEERVQVLAELARRIVNQVTHERDKVLRHAEEARGLNMRCCIHRPTSTAVSRSQRILYWTALARLFNLERLHRVRSNWDLTNPRKPPQYLDIAQFWNTALHHLSVEQLGPYKSTKALRSTLTSHNSGIRQLQPSPGSSRISVSTAKSPSRAKIQRTETLTTAEAARRATYHAKLSKLHAEDLVKRPARTKRLFESALRTLVKEGEVVLYEGPRRHVASSKSVGKRGFAASSELWPDVTNTTDGASSRHLSVASSKFTAHSSLDLETISEDDDEFAELSDPSDSEDAYVPVTPRVLRPALLTALRQTLMRHRGGVDFASWMRTLRADEHGLEFLI